MSYRAIVVSRLQAFAFYRRQLSRPRCSGVHLKKIRIIMSMNGGIKHLCVCSCLTAVVSFAWSAMVSGWVRKDVVAPRDLLISDSCEVTRKRLSGSDLPVTRSNADVASFADVVVLAVKPSAIPRVLREISPTVNSSKLIVSIAAGVSTDRIQSVRHALLLAIRFRSRTTCSYPTGVVTQSPPDHPGDA